MAKCKVQPSALNAPGRIFRSIIFMIAVFVTASVALGFEARAQEAYFGASARDVTPELKQELNLPFSFGALIESVVPESPAAEAGLEVNDVIAGFGEAEVLKASDLDAALSQLSPGAQVKISGFRGRAVLELTATLAEQTTNKAPALQVVGEPLLMLDTGGHTGKVTGAKFTPDGKTLISGSYDKVVRIWDWEAQKTKRFIRSRAQVGYDGTIFSLAISPNGELMAIGGFMGPGFGVRDHEVGDIRLFDIESGQMIRRFSFNNVQPTNDIAFSPDGSKMASGYIDGSVALWDVSTGALAQRFGGHSAEVYGVAFSADGSKVVSSSYDASIRIWDVQDGRILNELRGHAAQVHRLAISKDGLIASGDLAGEIRLWDLETGRMQKLLSVQDYSIGDVIFSPDGQYLIATCGGGNRASCAQRAETVWETKTGKRVTEYFGHYNVAFTADHHPTQPLIATAGGANNEIHVWNRETGETVAELVGSGGFVWAAGVSPDGASFGWGRTWGAHTTLGQNPVEFSMRLPQGRELLHEPVANTDKSAFNTVITTYEDLSLQLPNGGRDLDRTLLIRRGDEILGEITRDNKSGDDHRAYTFAPDGSYVISGGSNGYLALYDLQGREMRRLEGHVGDIWALATTPDGRILVSASADQTVKLWSLENRKLIATLFHGRNGDWVMWTPQGYYDGSIAAGEIVGWQLNHGLEQASSYVTAAQLGRWLHRPDIVARALALGDADTAIEEARAIDKAEGREGRTPLDVTSLLSNLPPTVRILGPSTGQGGGAILELAVRPNGKRIESFDISVGGVKVEPQPVTPRAGDGASGAATDDEELHYFRIPLARGSNKVSVRAISSAGSSAQVDGLIYLGEEGSLDRRGALRILAVGVDSYPGAAGFLPPLSYAGADASAFAQTAKETLGELYSEVKVDLLVNNGPADAQEPTKANIEAALNRIAAEAQDVDTVMLFVAGHGQRQGGDYFFLPTDLQRVVADALGENALDWSFVQDAVSRMKGRRLVLMDACRSGNAFNPTLLQKAYTDKFVAISSAGPDQLALEDAQYGHGLFTHALLQGLRGAAFNQDTRELRVLELGAYLTRTVRALSEGAQEPALYLGDRDYLLGQR